MKSKLFLFLVFCLGLSSCHVGRFFIWNFADVNDHKKFASVPVDKGEGTFTFAEGFTTADTSIFWMPDSIRLNGEQYHLEELLERNKTVAFLVIRNDTLFYEKYFYKREASSVHPSFSVAKSFVSALVGIAIEEGHIGGVEEPMVKYLPGLDEEEFGDITIEHLLNMRSGLAFNEGYFNPFGDVAKYYYGRHLRKYIQKMERERPPGENFRYISLNTQLLGIIVENATGRPLAEYLEEKIWKPLGMEYDASWSIDSKKDGQVKAFCCLNARARDFAKFGRLYLRGGQWEGRQIVPEDWVRRSTTYDSPLNGFRYKYQWWHRAKYQWVSDSLEVPEVHTRDTNREGREYISSHAGPFIAEGILGQYIYVNPEKNMIIVRLGKSGGKKDEMKGAWESLFDFLCRIN